MERVGVRELRQNLSVYPGRALMEMRHDGQHVVGDDRLQLLRNRLRVREVGDDEPRQTGQGHDGLGEIASSGLVEVEEHRCVALCSQLGAQRVEDRLALRTEPPQDQHSLLGHGVDDIPDLGVVEQQVDELGDLQVVDHDRSHVGGGDEQVPLLGRDAAEVPAPDRFALERNAPPRSTV